ncbi:FxSxx-COOH system tetratricopeptide repeat protein [Actinomadura sp. ATCC 39365]
MVAVGVAISSTLLVAGTLGLFTDSLWAPVDVLDVLDKRASVISMFVGLAGLFVAGAALLAQLRSSSSAQHLPAPPRTPAKAGKSLLIEQAGSTQGMGAATLTVRHALPPVADVPSIGITGMPRRPSSVFVGREYDLDLLNQALTVDPKAIIQAVVGLGGIGKSELALQYSIRHRDTYKQLWWIEAGTPESIQAGLARLCRTLCTAISSVAAAQAPTEEAAAWALAWLSSRSDWLVVFDNVDEIDHLQPYLGQLQAGHAVITSRRDIGWREIATVVHLDVLSRVDAVELLSQTISGSAIWVPSLANELAEELGGLPLALKQAGAYIAATPGMDLPRYLRLLRTAPRRVLTADGHRGRGSEQVIARTWAVTQDRIAETDPLAVRLLRLLACYAPDHLPCQVLYGVDGADEMAVAEALGALASYSMINRSPDGQHISVHRLVQSVTLADLSDDELTAVRTTAAQRLEAVLPNEPKDISFWPLYARLLPHARAVLAPDSSAMRNVIDYLDASGDDRTAQTLQQHRVKALSERLGAEHIETLTARNNLARWTGLAGDREAARDQYVALLPVMERVLGPKHPDTLSSRANFAFFTGWAGDQLAAREQYEILLPMMEQVLGPEHPSTLSTRADLARWTGFVGDACGAQDQYKALLPIVEQVLGLEHPSTLSARANFAYWLGMAGDAGTARDQCLVLLPVIKRVLGPEHRTTLGVWSGLIYLTGKAGDVIAARDHYIALLKVMERVRGPQHPDTLAERANHAHFTGLAGDALAAKEQYAALLPVMERILGPRHPQSVKVRTELVHWTERAERHP